MKITDLPDLLEISSNNKNKKLSKIDFLESLLKNFKDIKEIKDIINHSNLSKEQKEKLIEKFISKLKNKDNLKTNELSKLNNNIKILDKSINLKKSNNKKLKNNNIEIKADNKKNVKIDNKIILNKNLKKSPTIENLLKSEKKADKKNLSLNENELNLLLNIHTQTLKHISNEKEIIKKVKTIIIQKSINNPILNQIVKTDEFKNISSFKDLMKLSKKLNLNLVKIAISNEKQNPISHQIKNSIPIFKIKNSSKNNFSLKSTQKKDISLKTQPSKEKQTNKEKNALSLNELLKTDKNKNKINKHKTSLTDLLKKEKNIEKIKPIKNDTIENPKKIKEKIKKEDNQISIQNIQNEFKNQIISAKQTLKHFTSNLKEAVENYKPPVSKLTLELNPQNLGKVEVTIKQRGDNLNVQINTNNISTINFLTSTQQELKNSLVNMGFSNINMSFNSNQDNQQKQNQPQQKYSKHNKNNEEEELIIDFSYKYA